MGPIFLPEPHQASPVKTPHTALLTATVIFHMPRNEVALLARRLQADLVSLASLLQMEQYLRCVANAYRDMVPEEFRELLLTLAPPLSSCGGTRAPPTFLTSPRTPCCSTWIWPPTPRAPPPAPLFLLHPPGPQVCPAAPQGLDHRPQPTAPTAPHTGGQRQPAPLHPPGRQAQHRAPSTGVPRLSVTLHNHRPTGWAPSPPNCAQDQYWVYVANTLEDMAPKEFQDFLHALEPAPRLMQQHQEPPPQLRPQVVTQKARLLATRAPKVERPKLTQPHRLQHLPARPPFM